MIKRILILITTLAVFSTSANAATVLIVDLNTANQITISATAGASDVTTSGSDTIGFYLASFFASPISGSLGDALVSGDLTSAENTTDGTPDLFTAFGGSSGLNVFSFTDDLTADFVAGSLAFSGSATWTVSATTYAALLLGPASGDVFFPADTDDDLPGAMVIGQWERAVVPVPAAIWLLGSALAGFGVFGSRKKKA